MASVVELMNENGYEITRKGSLVGRCYGISHVAIQFCLRGEYEAYCDIMNNITRLSKNKKLEYRNKPERDILEFLDAVNLMWAVRAEDLVKADDLDASKNLGPFFSGRQDPRSCNAILNSNAEDGQGIHPVSKALKIFKNKEQLESFLIALRGSKESFGIEIGDVEHSMAITFSNGQWHYISNETFSSTQHGELSELLNIPNTDLKKVLEKGVCTIVEYRIGDVSDATCRHDKLETLHDNDNQRVLFIELAFQNGIDDAAKEYFVSILKLDLPAGEKANLFLAKHKDGKPAVVIGYVNGNAGVVKVYCESIQELNLPAANKAALLLAKDTYGNPSVQLACENGHAGAFKVYCESILKLNLPAAEKADLLLAKDAYGDPSVLTAYEHGHAGVVKVYCESIQELDLPAANKAALLLAKDTYGNPSVQLACENGHAGAVKACIASIHRLELPVEEEVKQLLFKNEAGLIFLEEWFFSDKENAIKTYCDSIDMSQLPVAIKNRIFSLKDVGYQLPPGIKNLMPRGNAVAGKGTTCLAPFNRLFKCFRRENTTSDEPCAARNRI